MKRPVEIRAPPRDWLVILKATYPFLRMKGVGDLVVFGSQALSLYMRYPLRSKDLDLISSQLSPSIHESLADELRRLGRIELKSTTVQTRTLSKGKLTTYSLELRFDKMPFFVEVFDAVLDGQPTSVLTPYVQNVRRWGMELWAPTPDAVVALRLAFRRPEGISRLNAERLSAFIRENENRLNYQNVREILEGWQMTSLVEQNLKELSRLHRLRVPHDTEIIPSMHLAP